MKTEAKKIAGLMTYWTARECVYEKLAALAKSADLGSALPPKRSTSVAIDAALDVCAKRLVSTGNVRYLVRPLTRQTGHTIVKETRGEVEAGNVYTEIVAVSVASRRSCGSRIESTTVRFGSDVPSELPDTAGINSEIDAQRKLLGRDKVSRFLALAIDKLWGSSLRPKGSIYWLPPDRTDDWARACQCVTESAHSEPTTIHGIRMEYDSAAVAAVTEALLTEIGNEGAALTKQVSADDVRPSQITNAIARSKDLGERVKSYTKLFGSGLKDLGEALKGIEGAAAMATLRQAVKAQSGAQG